MNEPFLAGLAISGNQLLSVSEDSTLVVWDMSAKRQGTPEWAERDCCERCARPFFWNVKAMLDQKQVRKRLIVVELFIRVFLAKCDNINKYLYSDQEGCSFTPSLRPTFERSISRERF